MKLLGISSLIAFSFIMFSCEKETLLHAMISTEFVDGTSKYTELVIPEYIETVFFDGEIDLRTGTLIVSVFSPDSVVQYREICNSQNTHYYFSDRFTAQPGVWIMTCKSINGNGYFTIDLHN